MHERVDAYFSEEKKAKRLLFSARLPAVLACLALGGCGGGVLDPQGPIARSEQTILLDALAIMLAIVIPTICAALGFAWWFRASNTRARYRPEFAYSGRLELLVWSIPLLVVLFLGGVTWIGAHRLDPAMPIESKVKVVNVQAVSLDWKWLFIYPDYGVATVNDMPLPAGTPIHVAITADTVMNAFFIPQLGGMIYAMNGMVTQLNLLADHPGTYPGLSSHFSGDGFSTMHFNARALSPDDFAKWIAEARAKGGDLTAQAYAGLEKPSSSVPIATYGHVDPSLFHDIATQAIGPGAGPRAAQICRPAAKQPEG